MRQICASVPREVCATVDREVCATVPTEKCADVPREVCETKCEDVFWCKVRSQPCPLLFWSSTVFWRYSTVCSQETSAYSLFPSVRNNFPSHSPVSCFRSATSNLSSSPSKPRAEADTAPSAAPLPSPTAYYKCQYLNKLYPSQLHSRRRFPLFIIYICI